GTSAEEIRNMVSELAASSESATYGQFMEVATAIAKTGKFAKDELKTITKATTEWVNATGESAEKVSGYFETIAKDPVKGLAELNESFNFL
ncbi:phage tail length tape measure family protein, partial [Enterobacter asburiae]